MLTPWNRSPSSRSQRVGRDARQTGAQHLRTRLLQEVPNDKAQLAGAMMKVIAGGG